MHYEIDVSLNIALTDSQISQKKLWFFFENNKHFLFRKTLNITTIIT